MILLEKSGRQPLYRQLYEAIKESVLSGETTGRLDSILVCSSKLGISANTVNAAYQMLVSEGYLLSVPGSGYYVNPTIPQEKTVQALSDAVSSGHEPYVRYDFWNGNATPSLFPWPKWRKAYHNGLLAEQKMWESGSSSSRPAIRALQEAIAMTVNDHRGIQCSPDQIVLCFSPAHLFRILLQLLPPETNKWGIEDPGYMPIRSSLVLHGYDLQPLSVAGEEAFLTSAEESGCNCFYVTPSHQYPTGSVLSPGARSRLLALAEQRNGYILEDDYDCEFSYDKPPLASIAASDQMGRVIYYGDLEKLLFPMGSLSFLILPPQLMKAFLSVDISSRLSIPPSSLFACADFMLSGEFDRYVHRVILACRKRYMMLLRIAKEASNPRVRLHATGSGVHMLLTVRTDKSENELLAWLLENGIRMYSIKEHFFAAPDPDAHTGSVTLLLGFIHISPDDLAEGFRKFLSLV